MLFQRIFNRQSTGIPGIPYSVTVYVYGTVNRDIKLPATSTEVYSAEMYFDSLD